MEWEKAEKLSEKKFRRLTGIKIKTFQKMLEILKKEEVEKEKNGGPKHKLSLENRLLMTLEYLREYRTYFHIGENYGVSESTAYKNICRIENILTRDPEFSLPGKKALLDTENQIEVILVDVTETPIERPKKNKKIITLGKRKSIH